MTKKILVPGAGIGQEIVLKKAKQMGLTTVVVSPKGDYPGFKYADIIYHENVRNEGKVLEIARKENIDGIVSDQNDIPVETIGYVAEKLNLTGNDYATSRIYCRKDLMREMCKKIDVPSLAYGRARDLEETLKIAREISYPVMCKPTDNQSSKGVYKVNNEDELLLVFDEVLSFAFSGEIIVEQYLEGKELIIDGLAIRGEYKDLLITENYNFDLKDVFIPKVKKSPTSLSEEEVRELKSIDKKINISFGVKNGRTHNEYLLNPHDGKFYLIDAAARGGGTFISSHLVPFACGFDAIEMQIRLALGEALDIRDYQTASKAVSYICFYLEEGEILHIEGLEKIKDMDCVIGIHDANLKVGERIKSMTDKSNRLGPILVGCDTLQEMDEAIKTIKDTLSVTTDKHSNAVVWE